MQGVVLPTVVEQFVAEGLVVGSLSELVEQLRTTAASVEPLHGRGRIGDVVEDGDQRSELCGDAVFRVAEDGAKFRLECVMGCFMSSPAHSCRGFSELGFEDVAVVAATKTYRLLGSWMRGMRRTADLTRALTSGEAAVA
ncbi:hypothetical protein CJ179_35955 [Rhodococcus sp. ACS1]|nr:hypothetical protein CJ179_35955 [Rhodococcus sp. ACS1]